MSVNDPLVPDPQTHMSVETRLAVMGLKIDQLLELNKTRGEDHETRLRKLEERRFPLQVMAVLISSVALIATVVGMLLTH